jgi:hypothetical protein
MKFALLIVLVACGAPAGGPLKYTFDNTKIATVSLDAKKSVTEAQQKADLAQLDKTKAEAEYSDSEVEQELAEYQAERAMLVSQLVASKQTDQPAPATAETTALARKAADAKVDFTRARHTYLASLSLSAFYEVYAAQAKLELERARVAQANNLVPAGFDLATYQRQAEDRVKAANDASAITAKDRQTAEAKLTAWNELEKAFMQAATLKGPSESDRVVEEWKKPSATPPPSPAAEPTAQNAQETAKP